MWIGYVNGIVLAIYGRPVNTEHYGCNWCHWLVPGTYED